MIAYVTMYWTDNRKPALTRKPQPTMSEWVSGDYSGIRLAMYV